MRIIRSSHVFLADVCNDHLIPSDWVRHRLSALLWLLVPVWLGFRRVLLCLGGWALRVQLLISASFVLIEPFDELLDIGYSIGAAPRLARFLLRSRHLTLEYKVRVWSNRESVVKSRRPPLNGILYVTPKAREG